MRFKNKLKAVSPCFTVLLILVSSKLCFSQEQRLADHNTLGWFVYTGTFKIKPKLAIHTDYQWRRVNTVKNWQQGLFRAGINYAVHKDVSLNAGYAFAETFPYGDYPNANAFPEHRIFEQVVLKQAIAKIELSHRFTVEQRFVGKVAFENNQKKSIVYQQASVNPITEKSEGISPSAGLGFKMALSQTLALKVGLEAWTSPITDDANVKTTYDIAARAGISWLF